MADWSEEFEADRVYERVDLTEIDAADLAESPVGVTVCVAVVAGARAERVRILGGMHANLRSARRCSDAVGREIQQLIIA